MMTLAKIQTAAAVLVVATVVTIVNVVVVEHVGGADEKNLNVPLTLTPRQFTSYQALIKPAAHESPWAKISWHASVWEAREQAAAEGKPILIWSGGGSPPLGAC